MQEAPQHGNNTMNNNYSDATRADDAQEEGAAASQRALAASPKDVAAAAPKPSELELHNAPDRAPAASSNQSKDVEMPDATPQAQQLEQDTGSEALSAPPMTTSNSSSSHTSQKEAPQSSYGTRSRNRPASQRPNYAEDVEMDFELQQNALGKSSTKAGATERPAPPSTKTTNGSKEASQMPWARFAGLHSDSKERKDSRDATPAKEQHMPGMSSFATQPLAAISAISKKRKAATSAAPPVTQNGASSTPQGAVNGTATATMTRRTAAVAAPPQSRVQSQTYTQTQAPRESRIFFFTKSKSLLNSKGELVADDGTNFAVDNFVYLVCEPPGEPYYLGRIMQFKHAESDDRSTPVDGMRINWFYRPRDVGRSIQDTRLLYATMHSDICPLTSLRGKVEIKHRSEIPDLDEYRKQKNSFWFEEVHDRFIHRYYRAIPTVDVINVPQRVKKALDDRWKYIVVEQSKVKELTTPGKNCVRCKNFAPPDESVECAICKNMYHMQCVRPPLAKKPSRGFGWSCAPCSRAQEKRLEARHTPIVGENADAEEEEILEEEEEEVPVPSESAAPSPTDPDSQIDLHPGTQAEIALAKMWPMRYLGVHCKPEDALQYDDRAIYPRASSRLGPRHQANVNVWHGRPVEYVKPADIKKRYAKTATHKKDGKYTKDTVAALEADRTERAKRPKWVLDEPPGYIRRGEDHPNADKDNTARLLFKLPEVGELSERGVDDAPNQPSEQLLDQYMSKAKAHATSVDISPHSVDFIDFAVKAYQDSNFDEEAALRVVRKVDAKKDLQFPSKILTQEEKKRFAEGAALYGSELRNIRIHINQNTNKVKQKDVVRYWYQWKKLPQGQEIWASYGGRKGAAKRAAVDKLADDVADDHDDSAFSSEKASLKKRGFCCKFCNAKRSRQWRRAPGVAPGTTVSADGGKSKDKDKAPGAQLLVALCDRCASFWRRYAIKWEEWEDVAKKVAQGGTKQMRRRIDDEVLQEFRNAQDGVGRNGTEDVVEPDNAITAGLSEPAKKKQKIDPAAAQAKEKQKIVAPPKLPTPPPPPLIPAQPRMAELPCAVCKGDCSSADPQTVVCSVCRLTAHRSCYGVTEVRTAKWVCDTCTNDRKESVSYHYECVLCPVTTRPWKLVEPPKTSHKKKGDREREKERLEKELAEQLERSYYNGQVIKARPVVPREALKRTTNNNWVHITCAMWHPETRLVNAKNMDLVEAVPLVHPERWKWKCKICSNNVNRGACVSCQQCSAHFHVGCADTHGYLFGFDVAPVKGSRRDALNVVTFGSETGVATAAIWCKEHHPKTIVHQSRDIVSRDDEAAVTVLQQYAATYKQADLTLTGTTRKANLLDESAKNFTNGTVINRRSSILSSAGGAGRGKVPNGTSEGHEPVQSPIAKDPSKRCIKCRTDSSPKWYAIEDENPKMERQPSHEAAHLRLNFLHRFDSPSQANSSRTGVQSSGALFCHKCYLRKKRGIEDPPELSFSRSESNSVPSPRIISQQETATGPIDHAPPPTSMPQYGVPHTREGVPPSQYQAQPPGDVRHYYAARGEDGLPNGPMAAAPPNAGLPLGSYTLNPAGPPHPTHHQPGPPPAAMATSLPPQPNAPLGIHIPGQVPNGHPFPHGSPPLMHATHAGAPPMLSPNSHPTHVLQGSSPRFSVAPAAPRPPPYGVPPVREYERPSLAPAEAGRPPAAVSQAWYDKPMYGQIAGTRENWMPNGPLAESWYGNRPPPAEAARLQHPMPPGRPDNDGNVQRGVRDVRDGRSDGGDRVQRMERMERPDTRPRPSTPRDASDAATLERREREAREGTSAASASPSLRNLIH